MKRFLIVGIIVALVVVAILYRRQWSRPISAPPGTIPVVATFYPLAYFAQAVGADRISVATIVPPGVEPHDFEPSARDSERIQQSRVFLTNGGEVDGWANRFVTPVKERGGVVVSMHEVLSDIDVNVDPHFWLDIVLAARQVRAIRDALIVADPQGKETYERNAEALTERLAQLDEQYRDGLRQCPQKEIIVSHNAFQFLSRRYGLTVHAIAGLSPHDEPSARAFADLSRLATSRHITTIFFESLVSPKIAETLANTLGARTMELNPIEGVALYDQQSGINYETLMQKNLDHLKTALGC